jgi:hypothetical protein
MLASPSDAKAARSWTAGLQARSCVAEITEDAGLQACRES